MIYSMTGYGKGMITWNGFNFNIEIKCLNSKNIDINIRSVSPWRSREMEIRSLLQERLHRGKVDLYINTDPSQPAPAAELNTELMQNLIQQMKKLEKENNLENQDILSAIMRVPDVVQQSNHVIEDEEWKLIEVELHKILDQVDEFRAREGLSLQKDLQNHISVIQERLEEVHEVEKTRIPSKGERLKAKVRDTNLPDIDENRLEQELIYFLEKMDINEEIARLTSHVEQMNVELLSKVKNKGKRLNFISQEMGREINTMGSKANHSGLQKLVIDMKDELEKIKEQLLNSL